MTDNRVSERLMTVQEVAERLHLAYETVRRYVHDGRLKGVKFGNRGGWRIRERDLEAFLEANKDLAA
jgi:excisionase family DNA binding protein